MTRSDKRNRESREVSADDAQNAIGERLRRLRRERDFSLASLETASGVSKGYLSQLENGSHSNPSIDTLRKLADTLGVPLTDLLGQEDLTPLVEARDLPPGLGAFIERARAEGTRIAQTDIEMLRGIRYRGRQPSKAEDWAHLFELIRRDAPNWGKG